MERDVKAYLKDFGSKVRQLREDRGWSQEEFAHRSGLHRTYISSLEQGKRNVSIVNVRAIAKAFGVTISNLLEDLK
jgi:transcriptional regulator with XRE-family HTH domain